jgi:hypothetical protein
VQVARIGEMKNAYNILVENPEGKRPLGRSSYSCESNIKTDLKEIWWWVMD